MVDWESHEVCCGDGDTKKFEALVEANNSAGMYEANSVSLLTQARFGAGTVNAAVDELAFTTL